jgi:hypothetical protein
MQILTAMCVLMAGPDKSKKPHSRWYSVKLSSCWKARFSERLVEGRPFGTASVRPHAAIQTVPAPGRSATGFLSLYSASCEKKHVRVNEQCRGGPRGAHEALKPAFRLDLLCMGENKLNLPILRSAINSPAIGCFPGCRRWGCLRRRFKIQNG